MEPIFTVGPFSIHLFGLFIGLGILAGFYVVLREGKRIQVNEDLIYDIALYGVLFGVIGARLYYVLAFAPEQYLSNPLRIFAITSGGLSIQGTLIAVVLFAVIYTRVKKINFWKIADLFVPALILGQAIGRIGCDVFGIPMQSVFFWGVKINNQVFHPVQIYESLLNFALFALLWNYRDRVKYHGQLFVIYIIGFSLNRGIVEFFRTNPVVIPPLTIAHVTSIIMIVGGLMCHYILRNRSRDQQPVMENTVSSKSKLISNLVILGLMIGSVAIYYSLY